VLHLFAQKHLGETQESRNWEKNLMGLIEQYAALLLSSENNSAAETTSN
jgi:hypothetical protein